MRATSSARDVTAKQRLGRAIAHGIEGICLHGKEGCDSQGKEEAHVVQVHDFKEGQGPDPIVERD